MRAIALGLTATLGVLVALAACSSGSTAVGAGGECFLATDCAPGLICVEQANRTRVCSDDLSRVVGEAPPQGDGDDEQADASIEDADGATPNDPPTQEAGPDTSMPEDEPTDAGDGGAI